MGSVGPERRIEHGTPFGSAAAGAGYFTLGPDRDAILGHLRRPEIEMDRITEAAPPGEAGGFPNLAGLPVQRRVKVQVEGGAYRVRALSRRRRRETAGLSRTLGAVGAADALVAVVQLALLVGVAARARDGGFDPDAGERADELLRDRSDATIKLAKAGHFTCAGNGRATNQAGRCRLRSGLTPNTPASRRWVVLERSYANVRGFLGPLKRAVANASRQDVDTLDGHVV